MNFVAIQDRIPSLLVSLNSAAGNARHTLESRSIGEAMVLLLLLSDIIEKESTNG